MSAAVRAAFWVIYFFEESQLSAQFINLRNSLSNFAGPLEQVLDFSKLA